MPMWVQMQLVPLPTTTLAESMVYWNVEDGIFVGDSAELVTQLVEQALAEGIAGVELTDPYRQPSELAVILSRYYIVVPEPMASAPNFIPTCSCCLH